MSNRLRLLNLGVACASGDKHANGNVICHVEMGDVLLGNLYNAFNNDKMKNVA